MSAPSVIVRTTRAMDTRLRERVRFRRGTMFCADAGTVDAAVLSGYTFTALAPEVLTRDSLIAKRGRSERYLARCTDGHRAFAYCDPAGAIAAYFWLTVAPSASLSVPWELGSCLMVSAGSAYIWDCYTTPAHRRRGLYTNGLRLLRAEAARGGCQQVAMCVGEDNDVSRAGILAAGFRAVRGFTILRIGSATLVRPLDGRSSLRWGTAAHPSLI